MQVIPKKYPVEFSVVIACYFEEHSIEEFHQRLTTSMQQSGRSFEIIFTNDGSTDRTWEKHKAIFEKDPHVSTIINFYRNYGQGSAMLAGICEARGENIIFIDSDLQFDPEDVLKLIPEFGPDVDVVTGYRQMRKDSLFRILPSKIANVIMRKVSGKHLKDFGCTFKIFRGDLLRAFESGPFKPWSTVYVLAHASKIVEIPLAHHPRRYGKSGYTFAKLLRTHMDNLARLSHRPFQYLSLITAVCGAILALRVLFSWVFPGASVLGQITPGLILNAIAISTLAILAVLCAIGEFSVRNFLVLQQDPQYIIREMYQRDLVRKDGN